MIYVFGKMFVSLFMLLFYPFNLRGANNIPKDGKAIIVANHSSNWDPLLIAMITYRVIHYLGKIELFKNKFFGWFFKQAHVIPVDRDNVKPRTVINCLKRLKEGEILGIFPEGTRVQEQSENISDGFVVFAIKSQSPIIPIHVEGKFRPWSKIDVIVGEPIILKEEFKKKIKDVDTKKIASDIMNQIYNLHI